MINKLNDTIEELCIDRALVCKLYSTLKTRFAQVKTSRDDFKKKCKILKEEAKVKDGVVEQLMKLIEETEELSKEDKFNILFR